MDKPQIRHWRRMASIAMFTAGMCTLMAHHAKAQCLPDKNLKGVNLAGAEFNSGKVPGVIDRDYIYPDDADLDYVVALGGNVIRLPFRWERIQPMLGESLNAVEVRRVDAVVRAASARGLCVILDIHNYGAYRKDVLGTAEVPVAAFHDLWLRLASEFSDPRTTIFGLMNEPAKLSIGEWAAIAQSTVAELRRKGAENIILVAGGRWSGVHEWFKVINGSSNAEALAGLTDPLGRTWIEAHQYADANYSGTGQECIDAGRFRNMFGQLSSWAVKNGHRLFLGEFGVPPNEKCLLALNEILTQMKGSEVWHGWTYWAAGRWWGNYPMSIQRKDGQEKPQTKVLRQYFLE